MGIESVVVDEQAGNDDVARVVGEGLLEVLVGGSGFEDEGDFEGEQERVQDCNCDQNLNGSQCVKLFSYSPSLHLSLIF